MKDHILWTRNFSNDSVEMVEKYDVDTVGTFARACVTPTRNKVVLMR